MGSTWINYVKQLPRPSNQSCWRGSSWQRHWNNWTYLVLCHALKSTFDGASGLWQRSRNNITRINCKCKSMQSHAYTKNITHANLFLMIPPLLSAKPHGEKTLAILKVTTSPLAENPRLQAFKSCMYSCHVSASIRESQSSSQKPPPLDSFAMAFSTVSSLSGTCEFQNVSGNHLPSVNHLWPPPNNSPTNRGWTSGDMQRCHPSASPWWDRTPGNDFFCHTKWANCTANLMLNGWLMVVLCDLFY